MAIRFYRALMVRQPKGVGVVFPELPGCVTLGSDGQSAGTNAIEALQLHIEGMVADGEELPAALPVDAPVPDWAMPDGDELATTLLVPVDIPGKAIRVNVTIDEALLHRIDMAASAEGLTRSGFLAQAARARLKPVGGNLPEAAE